MQCSIKRSPHQPTIQISGFTICDITNTGKQLCNPNETFIVVLKKKKKEISPFGVDFEICNFVDGFKPKHAHYTLTKIKKVKKHNMTPLTPKDGVCWRKLLVNLALGVKGLFHLSKKLNVSYQKPKQTQPR